jgi:hypothetical protein
MRQVVEGLCGKRPGAQPERTAYAPQYRDYEYILFCDEFLSWVPAR